MAHEKKQHIEESKSVIQDGIPLFRAEKVKAPFTFKGFWKNARHYATTIEHAQMYLDQGSELTKEFLPKGARILDLTNRGDFIVNCYDLKNAIPELGAAWDPLSISFDLSVVKEMGYDAVKFNDALGVTIVK